MLRGLIVAPLVVLSAGWLTAPAVEIKEWKVPWEDSRPRDPYVGPDGKVWFVGQRGNYIAYLEPASGEFKRYELDPRTLPHNLIVAEDGSVWYAGNAAQHIGKLDPKTGAVTKYPMPNGHPRDPHTLVFDGRGNIWFTAQQANAIGRLVMATGEVTIFDMPTPGARPYGIKVDRSGRPWAVLVGTNKLATVDPATMKLEEITLADEGTRPRRIEIASDGAIWYVDFAEGELGRYDPTTRTSQEWLTPRGAESRPYGTALDKQDRLWFVETGVSPNTFVGFDTRARKILESVPVPSGAGTVRHMYYHEPTHTVWFGTDANTIGKAVLP